MPIGGETIGRAYVKIIADGSGFGDDLERQIGESDGQMKAAGRNTSKAYHDGYDEETKKWNKKSQKQQLADLNKSLGKWEAAGQFAGSKYGKGLQDFLHRKFRDIGDQMFLDINKKVTTGKLDFDGLEAQLQNLGPMVAKATKKIKAETDKIYADDEARTKHEAATAASRKHEADLWAKYATVAINANKRVSTEVEKTHKTIGRGDGMWTRLQNRMRNFGNTAGKIFGRGSRNDLLNFFGGFVSATPRIIGALAGVGAWVAGLGESFRGLSGKVDFSGITNGLSSLASAGLPGLAGAAVLAGVMLETLFLSLGPLSSALVLASGAVLALAGSIGFALVGGIVAAAGAMVPLAAGIGVVALAIGGLNKKTKVFKDLSKEWKSLQKVASKAIFGDKQQGLAVLQNILEAIKPLIKDVGGAVGDLLEDLGKATGTKAFRDGIKDISDIITPMVPILGDIIKHIGTGLGQAFVAAAPMATDFLKSIDRIAKAFVALGDPKGARGGSKLADFFDKAQGSAMRVMDLVEQVGKVLATVFGAGKSTGDNLITKMADAAEKLNDWLTSAEGQKALKTLFKDAEKLFDKLGEIGGKLIEVLDALDTPTNRMMLFQLLDIAVGVLDFLAKTFTWVDKINTAMLTKGGEALKTWSDGWGHAKQRLDEVSNGTAWDVLKGHIAEVTNGTAWDSLKGRIGEAFNGTAFNSFKQRAGEAKAGITGFFAPMGAWFAGIGQQIAAGMAPGWTTLKQRATEAKNGITGAFSGMGSWAAGVGRSITANLNVGWSTLKQRAGEAKNGVVTAFKGLSGKIIKGAGNISSGFQGWLSSLPGKARATKTSIANAFSGLGKSAIAKAGSIKSAFSSWVSALPGNAKKVANSIASGFSGLGKKAFQKAGSITSAMSSWASGVKGRARGVADDIVSGFRGLAKRIVTAIGTIVPKIKMPNIPRPTVQAIVKVIKPKNTAAGGVFNGPEIRRIGEAGPEAVVPLNRPLSRVDPAVRALSAFAQGLPQPGGTTNTGPSIGRNIDVGGIVINTPTTDPRAVASEVVNRMTFAAYI